MKEYYKLGGRIQDDRSGMMGLQGMKHCYCIVTITGFMNEIMMRIRDSSRIRDSDFCMDPGARYRSRIHLGLDSGL